MTSNQYRNVSESRPIGSQTPSTLSTIYQSDAAPTTSIAARFDDSLSEGCLGPRCCTPGAQRRRVSAAPRVGGHMPRRASARPAYSLHETCTIIRRRRPGLRWDSHRIWGAEGVVPRSHRAARRRACGAQLSQRGARGTASAYPVRPTHRCCSGAARAPGGRAAVQHAHRCGSSARTAPRLQPAVQGLHRSGSSACSAQCVRRRCVLVHRSLSSARTAPERRLHVHEKVQQLLVRGCPHGS